MTLTNEHALHSILKKIGIHINRLIPTIDKREQKVQTVFLYKNGLTQ